MFVLLAQKLDEVITNDFCKQIPRDQSRPVLLIWPEYIRIWRYFKQHLLGMSLPNTEFKHISLDRLLEHSSPYFVHLNLQQATLPDMAVWELTSETLKCC